MSLRFKGPKFKNGFTFIDVLVGISLMLIVFLGIFGAYQLGLKVIGVSKNKITATAIANGEIEKIRNMSYEKVGIIGGSLPTASGTLEASTSTIVNGIEYKIERKIIYISDPADGIGLDDSCNLDYKRVEIKVSWSGRFPGEVKLGTDVAPKDKVQEIQSCTAQPAGILSVLVFDAYGNPVSNPLIEVKNPQTFETITSATPSFGKYDFPVASSTYKVVVSKGSEYTTDQTYGTNEIAIPEKPNPTVLIGQVTNISFQIDRVSSFTVYTLSTWGQEFFSDTFSDESKISEKSNVAISGGEVNLSKTPGVYFTGGTSDGDICSFPGIDGDCGQSFTMGSQSKVISQVQLYIRKTTTDVSNIYLEIRSESTIGPVLAQSYTLSADDIPGSLSWITFTLQSPVTLSANTQYFLRLRSIPNSTDPGAGAKGAIYWGYIHSASAPPAYASGDAWRYIGRDLNPSDPGQQLGPADQYDFSFKISDDEYLPSGYLFSTAITPTNLISWDTFSFSDSEPANTDLKYQIYYASETDWLLIPDSDLPGNSMGFDLSPVDLSNLATTVYSSLKLKANFSTNSTTSTPTLYDWQLSWKTSNPTSIPNATFSVRGEKLIGKDANENPVYKFSTTTQTDSSGKKDLLNWEWDNYTFSIPSGTGLDLVSSDPPQPVSLPPNSHLDVKLYLDSQNSLLVTVQDSETLEPIFSAQVRLYKSGYDKTQYANEKGQTYFIPLDVGSYSLEVSAPGYSTKTDSVSISGDVTKLITLTQSE
jgi:hypothetical protein